MKTFAELTQKALETPNENLTGEEHQTFGDTLVGQFAKSAGSSMLEMFGADAPSDTRDFRREYPKLGLVSEFTGIPVPYIGYYKAASKAKKFSDFVDGLGDAAKAPIRSTALQETVRLIPFETARLASAAVVNEGENLGEIFGEVVFDLGLTTGLGGIVGAFRASGPPVTKLTDVVPGVDLNAPAQIQMRELRNVINAGKVPEEMLDGARRRLDEFSRYIRNEDLKNQKYIGELASGHDGKQLNRLFKTATPEAARSPEKLKTVRRKLAVHSSAGFKSKADWQDVVKRAGLPNEWEEYGQFFRHLQAESSRAGKNLQGVVGKNMQSVGDGWYMTREANEGMYVMAKKVRGRDGTGQIKDEWLMFKTDSPSHFVPRRASWAQAQIAHSAWLQGRTPQGHQGIDIWDTLQDLTADIPLLNYIGLSKRLGGPRQLRDAFMKLTGMDKIAKGTRFTRQQFSDFLDEYVAPTMFQFRNHPRANWIVNMTRAAFDRATANTESIMYGAQQLTGKGNLFKDIYKGAEIKGGLKEKLDVLDDEDLFGVWTAWIDQLGVDEAVRQGITPRAEEFLRALEKTDIDLSGVLMKIQGLTGQKVFTPMPNHYMISRTWEGTYRVQIHNEGGELVYVAAGKDRAAAIKQADEIVDSARAEDEGWYRGEAVFSDRRQDLELAQRIAVGSKDFSLAAELRKQIQQKARQPKFLKERAGIEGYQGQLAPWSKKELEEILLDHVAQTNRYIAESSVLEQLGPSLDMLNLENPKVYNQVVQRINDLAGKPGLGAQTQNLITDKVLGPVLGKNSATKIAKTANSLMMHFQLGAGNVGFPILNALTFMQTVLPQISFIMTAAPERVAKFYTHWPIAGADGKPVGSLGVLDMFKLMRQSFKEMGRADSVLMENFERAAKEQVWDPRLVEEYVGQNAKRVTKFKDVVNGDEPFVGYLKSVSEFMPANSEKFARGHSFVVGHILGRDFLKMEGDQLYRFAKEFTNNTMFLYSTADRARIMTGPLGSMFGMFKNWQMHYLYSMMEYAGEGFARGNFAPLLWMAGGTTAVGGVSALPLYYTANSMSQWMTDESLMNHIYGMFGGTERDRGTVADGVFLGLPSFLPSLVGLPAVSLSGQAAAPFNNPARDASMLFSFVHWDRMRALSKAVGTSVDKWKATGEHPIDSQAVRDQFIRALAPKTVYRSAAAIEGNYIKSLATGYPQIKNIRPAERVLYSLGMNPRWLDLQYRISDELWQNQNKMQKEIQRLGAAWAEAEDRRDSQTLLDIMSIANRSAVDMSSVIRSAKSRQAKGAEDMIERQFDPNNYLPFRRLGLIE